MDFGFIQVLVVLLLISFSTLSFSEIAKPLDIYSRTPLGEFARCETTGWYVWNGGFTTYEIMTMELNFEIASRLARGMV
jgi:hypothetical protein